MNSSSIYHRSSCYVSCMHSKVYQRGVNGASAPHSRPAPGLCTKATSSAGWCTLRGRHYGISAAWNAYRYLTFA